MAKFHYSPPILLNNLFFGICFVLFSIWLQLAGDQTWVWFMDKMSIETFVIVVGFAFYMIVFWGVGGMYIRLTNTGKPAALYKYKIQEIPDYKKKKPRVPLSKAVKLVLFNQFIGTLPFLVGVIYIMRAMNYPEYPPVPACWVVVLQMIAMILIEDILFFTAHYILHIKWFFKKFHRVHHEYRESIAIATHYVHYVEHIFGNLIPVFAGVVILQPHPFVVLFWIFMVVVNALHTHSGYAIPWMSYSVHHDWHHYHVNGSFSAIGLMDKIFGTDKAFDKIAAESKDPAKG